MLPLATKEVTILDGFPTLSWWHVKNLKTFSGARVLAVKRKPKTIQGTK